MLGSNALISLKCEAIEIIPIIVPDKPEINNNFIARRSASSVLFNSIIDQTFTLLPIILKALKKSERSPEAISRGKLNPKTTTILARSIKDTKDPLSKVEKIKKAMNNTKPTKYIIIPPDI